MEQHQFKYTDQWLSEILLPSLKWSIERFCHCADLFLMSYSSASSIYYFFLILFALEWAFTKEDVLFQLLLVTIFIFLLL